MDIVCLSETWLNADVLDHEILPTGYNVYRKDRPVKRGGGVLIAVNSSYSSCLIKLPTIWNELEVIAVEIDPLLNDRKILILYCYRPPNDNDFIQAFKVLLNSVQLNKYFTTIILGNFNLPNITWFDGAGFTKSSSSDEQIFVDLLKDLFLFQLMEIPTRRSNI